MGWKQTYPPQGPKVAHRRCYVTRLNRAAMAPGKCSSGGGATAGNAQPQRALGLVIQEEDAGSPGAVPAVGGRGFAPEPKPRPVSPASGRTGAGVPLGVPAQRRVVVGRGGTEGAEVKGGKKYPWNWGVGG